MKGDGWAVKRYICPVCKKKGLYAHYYSGNYGGVSWFCMYKKRHDDYSEGGYSKTIKYEDVLLANPELSKDKIRYKADGAYKHYKK